jgi:hypothetical protein
VHCSAACHSSQLSAELALQAAPQHSVRLVAPLCLLHGGTRCLLQRTRQPGAAGVLPGCCLLQCPRLSRA